MKEKAEEKLEEKLEEKAKVNVFKHLLKRKRYDRHYVIVNGWMAIKEENI